MEAKTTAKASAPSAQIVTFRLGTEEYGIDIMKIQEIILMGDITRVPEVPDFIEGVINLRGNVIPIIDLRKRFKLPATERMEATRIIVVNVEGKTMGVVVDSVSEVLRINPANIDPTPPTIAGMAKEYLKGLVKLEKRLLILLDIDQILDLNEKTAI